MRRRVLGLGCLLTLLLIYVVCPFRLGIVCGASMEPTYHSGQPILIDRAYYRRHPIARGDVILLRVRGQTLIKRVFALAGDSFPVLVWPDETGVTRFILQEENVAHVRRAQRRLPWQRVTRVRVPPGHVYVVGDNPIASVDSRDFGCVALSEVIGRVPEGAHRLAARNSGVRPTGAGESVGAELRTRLARRAGY